MKATQLEELISKIDHIVEAISLEEAEVQELIRDVHPVYHKSVKNLIHYNGFRKFDLRKIQKKFRYLGLTRLAHAEGHVMSSLLKSKFILQRLLGDPSPPNLKSGLSIKNGERILAKHAKELFGFRSKGRRVRIMVTLPTEAAYNYNLVYEMVASGMNCARINCAHDGPEVWMKMVEHIKQASQELGRSIKIAMDLAGPKIRTGSIVAGPRVKKFRPVKDIKGRVIKPATIIMEGNPEAGSAMDMLPVDPAWLGQLRLGDKLFITDARNKVRKLKVVEVLENQIMLSCQKTLYVETGATIRSRSSHVEDIEVGELPATEQAIILRKDDILKVTKLNVIGSLPLFDGEGKLLKPASISCQLPEIFDRIKEGEAILFDDGKIEGVIETIFPDHFEVRITRAKEKGSKLRAEKGMNFPRTDLKLGGLTEKDKTDLEFVSKYADILNYSFVNTKEDVAVLLSELEKWNAINSVSIILKIETRLAFDNLVEILLAAMKVKYIGVMIARGDLAVETGWDTIGKVQEEILALCGAAHVPVVWATQVLENLAKEGFPSRSEITDTVSSLRAECVMLNKGPYIKEAIQLLNTILSDMERFHEKNQAMLPKMEKL
ncbi:MAG: pyruvate kinase [Flavobacteriaceae bacterium]